LDSLRRMLDEGMLAEGLSQDERAALQEAAAPDSVPGEGPARHQN